ncbi:hypothetical protein KDU71_14730 [Carboxylicivirga sediminis]|uniref:Anti-sigma factor n=1 Tax=Carboxylicivirga sediminis TaxID=2006564 RepID=A0A941F5H6_9BACT|nr:hypothetical protein [Carboxylicivirga sediminis]MBR8536827.1 hypothetical protein [Carboxylicivirga sediminis]
MPNSWEQYFEENRAQLDIHQPDEERMWQAIAERQKSGGVVKNWGFRIAIAIAVVLAVGVFVRHELMMQQQLDTLAAINKELAAKEHDYIMRVNQKWDEFRSLPSVETDYDAMLQEEIKILDDIYSKCLDDIKAHGYNERAVLIMLDTYEKRLRVLERLINEKRKQNKDEKKSNHIRI